MTYQQQRENAMSSETPASNEGQKTVEASFVQFLSGMAAQALMHLGAISNPLTNQTTVDLPNAKYSIDLLAILEEKTKGNLTEEESRYLAAALHELRLRYVDVTQGAGAATSDGEASSGASDDASATAEEEGAETP